MFFVLPFTRMMTLGKLLILDGDSTYLTGLL